ncbi:MAG: AAA family ATPase [Dehalococcoidia bacterium]
MVSEAAAAGGGSPLSAAVAPLCSLGLYNGRASGPIVGRPRELSAIRQGLASARAGLTCTVIEGEPGIGKTRFLLAVDELAATQGFIPVAVTADEEIRGPFLLARSIFGCPVLAEAIRGTAAQGPAARAMDALANREQGLESMPADQRLVRVFDLAAIGLRAVAAVRPVALLIDDLQWSDEDSLRLLRYVVRTDTASRIFMVLAIRPNETALVSEATTLLADVERLGILQRLRLERFSQVESSEFLEQTLGGRVDPASASIMHGQAEGVPFVLSEQVRAYREAGLIQRVDGIWMLARNAERLLPSAVRTLIQRRAAHLPEETRDVLAEAAVLGRNFSLRDLRDVKGYLGEPVRDPGDLAALLRPATEIGLLLQHPDGSAADYSFTHEGVREYAAGTLAPPRRRAIHGAVVDMLTAGGAPAAASLSLLAGHALAAGRPELCARFAIEAAHAAMTANAPEEVLRLVNLARPVATSAQDRVALLRLRDDALGMLRRPAQRIEGLGELSALAEALGDAHLELDVMLRRAAALRLSGESDIATSLARRVRERAAELGDTEAELTACIELGQDLMGAELGDASSQGASDADFDGAEEAYSRALAIAEARGDDAMIAAASRELGMIDTCRVRAWFVERVRAGEHVGVIKSLLGGARLEDILTDLPIAPWVTSSVAKYQRALQIYERLGDRRGVMSTVVSMAYASWAPGIHLSGSVQHVEELRRLTARVKSFTRESERALADAQMLYGSHVYARIRGFPDLAITKGQEAYNAARALGDRTIEFATAGGVAAQYAELGRASEAQRWLSRAASVAAESSTPFRALQLELWRGTVSAEAEDVGAMREHLMQAVTIAGEQGRPAARCDALSCFAAHAARLGAARSDPALLEEAERAAGEAEALARTLPGHPPWRAIAMGARVRVLLARAEADAALELGRAVLILLHEAAHEDFVLEALLPAASAVLARGTAEEQAALRDQLQTIATMVVQRVADEDVRVRWFAGHTGRELVALGGSSTAPGAEHPDHAPALLGEADRQLLRLVTEARSNAEIAATLGVDAQQVERDLAGLFARIGVATRADATTVALTGSLV